MDAAAANLKTVPLPIEPHLRPSRRWLLWATPALLALIACIYMLRRHQLALALACLAPPLLFLIFTLRRAARSASAGIDRMNAGDLDGARIELTRALRQSRMQPRQHAIFLAALAKLELSANRPEAALPVLSSSWKESLKDQPAVQSGIALLFAEAWRRAGDEPAAQAWSAESARLLQALPTAPEARHGNWLTGASLAAVLLGGAGFIGAEHNYPLPDFCNEPLIAAYVLAAVGALAWLTFIWRNALPAARSKDARMLLVIPAMVGALGFALCGGVLGMAINVYFDRSEATVWRCPLLKRGHCGGDSLLLELGDPRSAGKSIKACLSRAEARPFLNGASALIVRAHPGALGATWVESYSSGD